MTFLSLDVVFLRLFGFVGGVFGSDRALLPLGARVYGKRQASNVKRKAPAVPRLLPLRSVEPASVRTRRRSDGRRDRSRCPRPEEGNNAYSRACSTILKVFLDLVGSFAGRAEALQMAQQALSGGRSVMLVGPPGIGRTRTAKEIVEQSGAGSSVFIRGLHGLSHVPLGAVGSVLAHDDQLD